MWLEDNKTFDLEADESQEAIKKYEAKESRRKAKLLSSNPTPAESNTSNSAPSKKLFGITRHSVTNNFNVEGLS